MGNIIGNNYLTMRSYLTARRRAPILPTPLREHFTASHRALHLRRQLKGRHNAADLLLATLTFAHFRHSTSLVRNAARN